MATNNASSRIFFPKLNAPIHLSQHAALRLKQRAGLKSKRKRSEFLKNVAKSAITMSDIPLIDKFASFTLYLRQVYKRVRKKNIYCMIYVYKEYILIVSVDSVIITIINIDEEYKDYFKMVKEYIEENK